MKRRVVAIAALCVSTFASSVAAVECTDFGELLGKGCRRIVDTYENGSNELLVSGYAWHLPWTWTAERRREENEYAWGGGWARSVERPNGDTDSVFFLAFQDSHRNVQFNVGYSWTTYWGERRYVQPGLGFTAMIIQRPDIASGVPVPVLLPLFTLRYQKAELLTTYIPNFGGGINHGSVLYVFGRIGLN